MKNKFLSLWLTLVIILFFILQNTIPNFTNLFVLNQSAFSQPWRFLTAIFLHGSLTHLLFNLFALVLFGLILEKLVGSYKFLIVFFASGLIANLIAVNFYNSSLGASGAIYGILGALTVIKPLMVIFAFNLPMPMFLAAILWIIAGVIGIFVPSTTGDIAHLSGIAIGIILGIFFRRRKQVQYSYKITTSGNKFPDSAQKFERTERISDIPENYMRNWENKFMKK